jgi:hypothetical protein
MGVNYVYKKACSVASFMSCVMGYGWVVIGDLFEKSGYVAPDFFLLGFEYRFCSIGV